jgi:hypothetical protein
MRLQKDKLCDSGSESATYPLTNEVLSLIIEHVISFAATAATKKMMELRSWLWLRKTGCSTQMLKGIENIFENVFVSADNLF